MYNTSLQVQKSVQQWKNINALLQTIEKYSNGNISMLQTYHGYDISVGPWAHLLQLNA